MEVRILVHLQSGEMALDDYIELLSWIKTRYGGQKSSLTIKGDEMLLLLELEQIEWQQWKGRKNEQFFQLLQSTGLILKWDAHPDRPL